MNELLDFIRDNGKLIFLIVVFIFILLVVMKIKDIHLDDNSKTTSKTTQEAVYQKG